MNVAKNNLVFLILIALTVLLGIAPAWSQTPQVRVRPQSGTVEESFLLSVSLRGDDSREIEPPNIHPSANFSLTNNGTSTNHTIINGRHSYEITFEYAFLPNPGLKPGRYSLGKGTIEIDADTIALDIPEVSIEAQGINTQNERGRFGVDFVQFVKNLRPYVGQQTFYRMEIATTRQLVKPAISQESFDGFWHESFGSIAEEVRSYGGTMTRVYSGKEALFPSRAGQIRIPERTLTTGIVVEEEAPRRSHSLFQGIFRDMYGLTTRTVERRVIAPALTIDVRPLPTPTIPLSGYVPVGHIQVYDRIESAVLKQGSSSTLEIVVSGDGNLRPLELPPIPDDISQTMKVYPEAPKIEVLNQTDSIRFKKTFRVALVPTQAGQLKVPSFRFVSFDPDKGEYKVHQTKESTLTVLADPNAISLPAVSTPEKRSPTQLSPTSESPRPVAPPNPLPGFRPQKALTLGMLTATSSPRQWWFAWLCAPLVLFVLGGRRIWQFVHAHLSRWNQKRSAAKIFLKSLDSLPLESPNTALEKIHDGLKQFLFARFQLQLLSLGASDLGAALSAIAPGKTLPDTLQCFETLQRLRYQPQHLQTQAEIQQLRTEVRQLVQELERLGQVPHRKSTTALLAFFLLFAGFNSQASAAEHEQLLQSAEESFQKGDFSRAAQRYEEILSQGVENAALLYNLGNSYVGQGDLGRAIANYRRALLFAPRDEDIRANLAAARNKILAGMSQPTSSSSALEASYGLLRLSIREWQVLFLVAYNMFFLCAVLRLYRKKGSLTLLLLLSLLLSCWAAPAAFFSQLGMRQEICLGSTTKQAVVVTKNAQAYSGRSRKFSIVQKLPAGTELEVELFDDKPKWLGFRLPSGRVAYTPRENLEFVEDIMRFSIKNS